MDIDRWMHRQDPDGVQIETGPIAVTAGPHRVSAAFIKRVDGPLDDLMAPHEWSLADKKIGYSHGITVVAHLRDLTIRGPFRVTGASDISSRRQIMPCEPESPDESRACAQTIIERLATQAYRRPLNTEDIEPLLTLYELGAEDDGFEAGVRTALQGILASPDFVFRFEKPPTTGQEEDTYRISDLDLASRLSFFLWAMPPDKELIEAARTGQLSEIEGRTAQVRRMLADPRAESSPRRNSLPRLLPTACGRHAPRDPALFRTLSPGRPTIFRVVHCGLYIRKRTTRAALWDGEHFWNTLPLGSISR